MVCCSPFWLFASSHCISFPICLCCCLLSRVLARLDKLSALYLDEDEMLVRRASYISQLLVRVAHLPISNHIGSGRCLGMMPIYFEPLFHSTDEAFCPTNRAPARHTLDEGAKTRGAEFPPAVFCNGKYKLVPVSKSKPCRRLEVWVGMGSLKVRLRQRRRVVTPFLAHRACEPLARHPPEIRHPQH